MPLLKKQKTSIDDMLPDKLFNPFSCKINSHKRSDDHDSFLFDTYFNLSSKTGQIQLGFEGERRQLMSCYTPRCSRTAIDSKSKTGRRNNQNNLYLKNVP